MTTVLGPRALNRALLARQLLLERRAMPAAEARFLLVDGRVSATWTTAGDGDGTELRITPRRRLGAGDRAAIVDEGERLLGFLTDGAAAGRVEILAQ